jgi:DNA end-binding protein Ku
MKSGGPTGHPAQFALVIEGMRCILRGVPSFGAPSIRLISPRCTGLRVPRRHDWHMLCLTDGMHPLWRGAISFGLVNIPVSLFSGIRRDEDIHFHLLRKTDQSRVRNQRVAEADDKEVAWADIVKGYEYEKGKYIVLSEEELDAVELKSTRLIDIASFVDVADIEPVYFATPYLIQAEKGGEKAYHLLADVLAETKTAAIAKIVLRGGREHLVAVMARDRRLVAEMLYFHAELQPASLVSAPEGKVQEREREMARKLIDSMKAEWNPDAFQDDYEKALKRLIARKLSGKKIKAPAKESATRPGNVIDLVDILRQSLDQKGGKKAKPARQSGGKSKAAKATKIASPHRKAA